MKKEIKIDLASLEPIIEGVKRFGFTIFLVVVTSGLIATIFLLNGVVDRSTEVVETPGTNIQSPDEPQELFDTETIKNLEPLRESDKNKAPASTNDRTNPFN